MVISPLDENHAFRGRFRRPILVCMACTILGELFLLLVFGVWLFPTGSLLSKTFWTIAFCGTGMGLVAGATIGVLVVPRYNGLKAIAATVGIFVCILGIGRNLLCFSIDRHLNHFGAIEQPLLWLSSGILLSIIGGVVAGAFLFTDWGCRLLDGLRV